MTAPEKPLHDLTADELIDALTEAENDFDQARMAAIEEELAKRGMER